MSIVESIVWQGSCALCGWTSAFGSREQCKVEARAHIEQQHLCPEEALVWIESHEVVNQECMFTP